MLVVKDDLKCAVYSVGKTGSTSLLNTITPAWRGVGEYSADFMFELAADYYDNLYKNRISRFVDQYSAAQYVAGIADEFYCIVRDPWERYVSGIKEILQDSISALGDTEYFRGVWQHLMTNPDHLQQHINRIFYLSEYKTDKNLPSSYAIHYNYHTRNWLHEVEHLVENYGATPILSNNLDTLITQLGLTPGSRQNVSNPAEIELIKTALVNSETYANRLNIIDYVNQDIDIFNRLFPDHGVKKL